MSDIGVKFAAIRTALEDMHGVAIEGQTPALTTDEGWALLEALRNGLQEVGRKMADVALTLG